MNREDMIKLGRYHVVTPGPLFQGMTDYLDEEVRRLTITISFLKERAHATSDTRILVSQEQRKLTATDLLHKLKEVRDE